jgi:hypothetical protein
VEVTGNTDEVASRRIKKNKEEHLVSKEKENKKIII